MFCFGNEPKQVWDFGKEETRAVFSSDSIEEEEMQKLFSPFNHAPELIPYYLYLKNQFGITTAIETGTWKGETTRFLASIFDQVHSIEIQEEFFVQASEELSSFSNLRLHHGNSPEVLQSILPELSSERILFYLDAHWFSYWPLLDELEAIGTTRKDACIIIIDDVKVPFRPDIPYDSYEGEECGLAYIERALNRLFPSYEYCYLLPKSPLSRAKLVIIPGFTGNALQTIHSCSSVNRNPGNR